jgi:uncharacterized protein YbjQ (UPF0145 family)
MAIGYDYSEEAVVERKKTFLINYAFSGIIRAAGEAAGVSRATVKRWQEIDETFAELMKEAQEEAVERLEEEAQRRAVRGVVDVKPIFYKGDQCGEHTVTTYSDSLLTLMLKANKPEKYKERIDVTTTALVKSYAGIDLDRI